MPWTYLRNALSAARDGGIRDALDRLKDTLGLETSDTPVTSRVAFTMAVVSLAAKMSKADGVSSPVEAEAFERQFAIPDSEHANVKRLFRLAAQDTAGFEVYATQIARMLANDKQLKISVLECLFHIASADGILHPDEDAYLARVGEIFELTGPEFRCVRRGFVYDPDSPYEVLDIAPKASDADLKARYRELVKTHHPDALVAKGVPPEFLAGAQRRLAAITSAYEEILAERGKRVERALERHE